MLATASQLAGYLRRDFDAYDTYTAELVLAGASDLIVEYAGWHISPSITETLVVDGSGTIIQPLPTLRLTDVAAVVEGGLAVPAANYTWSDNGLLEKIRFGSWTGQRRGITATITHGWDTPPGWVVTLACAVAGRAVMVKPGIVSEVAGEDQVIYAGTFTVPPGSIALLDIEKKMLDRIAVPRRA